MMCWCGAFVCCIECVVSHLITGCVGVMREYSVLKVY